MKLEIKYLRLVQIKRTIDEINVLKDCLHTVNQALSHPIARRTCIQTAYIVPRRRNFSGPSRLHLATSFPKESHLKPLFATARTIDNQPLQEQYITSRSSSEATVKPFRKCFILSIAGTYSSCNLI
jgi:hypothetical protein